jgi:hypothetical protein
MEGSERMIVLAKQVLPGVRGNNRHKNLRFRGGPNWGPTTASLSPFRARDVGATTSYNIVSEECPHQSRSSMVDS